MGSKGLVPLGGSRSALCASNEAVPFATLQVLIRGFTAALSVDMLRVSQAASVRRPLKAAAVGWGGCEGGADLQVTPGRLPVSYWFQLGPHQRFSIRSCKDDVVGGPP